MTHSRFHGILNDKYIPAYVYDPVAVDEMPPMARITGIPELPRRMMGHALNTRAMAIRCAETVLHKPFDQCRLIVLHLGGGASVRLFIGGKMVDNVRDDELLFAPERMMCRRKSRWITLRNRRTASCKKIPTLPN